ncbi:MAG: TIGR01458 family HAD-type hydrolase [Methanomicrobiaceae archaeon]|nr:TIGR01458 family HAD-type hydrolase [Methanomicrobiaceae archaeon]
MDDTQGVLLDIDGVLSVGGRPIEGAIDAIAFLREEGLPFHCISNTTRQPRRAIAGRLEAMGLAIPEAHIFTPAVAAAALLAERSLTRCMLLVLDVVRQDFEAAGILSAIETVDAVVVGDAGERMTYHAINRAFRSILDGAPLIALEKDRYWRDADGLSLSAGPFVAALEYATGTTAELVGKPSPAFFAWALEALGTAPGRTLMVGDDIDTDIAGAQGCGIRGVLVRTGKYREDLVEEAGVRPYAIIDSIADLPGLIGR